MWAQILSAALGIWLIAAPAVLGYEGPAADNDRILGPIIATFAIVAWWEATRNTRWANLPAAVWLLAAPWVLGYDATAATINSMVVGALVLGLSLVRGTVKQQFGGGWRSLFRSDTPHEQAARQQYGTAE